MKYQNGGDFRRALEQRLHSQSIKTGVPLVRLRKMVAFDRFLARLQPEQWVLKGGVALQLRLGSRARTTKDIDVLALLQPSEITAALRKAGSIPFFLLSGHAANRREAACPHAATSIRRQLTPQRHSGYYLALRSWGDRWGSPVERSPGHIHCDGNPPNSGEPSCPHP